MNQTILERTTERCNRPGVSVIESIASLAVMAVLIAFVAQWTLAMMQNRRAHERRRGALQATENVMALAMATPYDTLTEAHLWELAELLTPRRATWGIKVEPVLEADSATRSKRVVVEVNYDASLQFQLRPIVAWKYPEVAGDAP